MLCKGALNFGRSGVLLVTRKRHRIPFPRWSVGTIDNLSLKGVAVKSAINWLGPPFDRLRMNGITV